MRISDIQRLPTVFEPITTIIHRKRRAFSTKDDNSPIAWSVRGVINSQVTTDAIARGEQLGKLNLIGGVALETAAMPSAKRCVRVMSCHGFHWEGTILSNIYGYYWRSTPLNNINHG